MSGHGAPILAGTLLVLAAAAWLTVDSPSPGPLAAAHSAIPDSDRLTGCGLCHTSDGLDAGCVRCHLDIGKQIEERRGFHAFLIGEETPNCARCHPDHDGHDFDILDALSWEKTDPARFSHPHVTFTLRGKHEGLTCERCHRPELGLKHGAQGSDRHETFLGLTQECVSCHKDIHGGFPDCAHCHDQLDFKAATLFDHEPLFTLKGAHAAVECKQCHTAVWSQERGKRCVDCHKTPHRADLGNDCAACHPITEPDWNVAAATFDAGIHARIGFPLDRPHAGVSCDKCHPPAAKFAEPPRRPDDCRTCHEDIHRGQFGTRSCLECHARDTFKPAVYTREQHTTFALRGAHTTAECRLCHKDIEGCVRFTGSPRACKECHEDIHLGQFKEECSVCHTEERFLPARYDIATHTQFPLDGLHRGVACRACHVDPVEGPRLFVGTTHSCKACHKDPHGGQFRAAADCNSCHTTAGFRIPDYRHKDYRLLGGHARARCEECHRVAKGVRIYSGTPQQCASCHRDEHRGQFREKGGARCERCHVSTETWKENRFEHNRMSRFVLDTTHEKVKCSGCHPSVQQPDGSHVVQYKPLGTRCEDCHEISR